MSVTQYIGARYVPIFAEPLDWDKTREYEPLTIVYYGGNSYTSRQAVPKGIDISNNEYWALTGNYNAQIDECRKDSRQASAKADSAYGAIMGFTKEAAKIGVFGDSTLITGTKTVVDYIKEMVPDKWIVENCAVGGTIFSNVNDQITNSSKDFDYVVVASGTNDWQGGKPPYNVSRENYGPLFNDNVDSVMKNFSTELPNATVLFLTPAWASNANGYVNSVGCTVSAYGDIIESYARDYGYGVIRLDSALGVNESNYRRTMVSSASTEHPEWADVYVHYSDRTKNRLAKLICNALTGGSMSPSAPQGLDVSPVTFFDVKEAPVYALGSKGQLNQTTHTVKLNAGEKYWLSGIMANDVTISGVTYSIPNYMSLFQIPFIVPQNGIVNIKFKTNYVFNARITSERPNIYSTLQQVVPIADKVSGPFTYKATGNVHVLNYSAANVTLPENAYTEFATCDLYTDNRAVILTGFANVPDNIAAEASCRLEGGKLYLNSRSLFGKSATTLKLAGVW